MMWDAFNKRSPVAPPVWGWLVLGWASVLGALPLERLAWAQTTAVSSQEPACVAIERSLPPKGLDIAAPQLAAWQQRLDQLSAKAAEVDPRLRSDVEVLLKAVRLAIEFQELYTERDFGKVDRLLALAEQRLEAIAHGEATWVDAAGRQVRGFRSQVDGSVQPVGLWLPEDWQSASRPLPLYVWLHGRGDKTTDLHFVCERLDKDGQITPPGAIVVHPFGRQCVGYKSAGETDVMEAIEFVAGHYPVDRQRIVLMGFSMGGAGAWHLAAHYAERFVAVSPGAGFAETARYQNIRPDDVPVYEQMLWGVYDVPGYTRNLFNLPVVAYSGEMDKQIQAARVMEEAFAAQGRQLKHIIGPRMGHKYHPDSLAEILEHMAAAAADGQSSQPEQVFVQGKHPRYTRYRWLEVDAPEEQYADTRATARRSGGEWEIATHNVARLTLDARQPAAPQAAVTLDGQTLRVSAGQLTRFARNEQGEWQTVPQFPAIRKRPGLSGPIDDAFVEPFLVVLPTGTSPHPRVAQWVRCESENLAQRWQMLFRGQLRTKLDTQVTPQDMADYHLLLWGDPASNHLLRKMMLAAARQWPVPSWSESHVTVGQTQYAAESHVLLAIGPNPLAPEKYVVLNSGPTFRQAHDRTNSLQNPHLPDWAVISLDEPPSAARPGKIAAAGFFDDRWQVDHQLSW